VGRLAAEVRRFAAAHALTGPGVVAVSGGPDSVALLRALVQAGAGPLTVGHVNHKLRGDESDGDEAFVRDLAGRLGLPVAVRVADPRPLGGNLEATARRLRYEFLHSVGGWVATGHTLDDQAETVLHHLIRGTGLDGLRGIAADWRAGSVSDRSDQPPATGVLRGEEVALRSLTLPARLVRPMLAVSRADVLGYLAELGQPCRTDASNADPAFTRNRIRAELLPLLRTFNPQVTAALGRLGEQAAEAIDGRDERAATLLAVAELPRTGDVVVLLADSPLTRDAVRLLWRREGWPTDRMTHAHWQRLAALAPGDYPGGVSVRRVGRVVQLVRR
jgi:tRNA(Ile)-lysidine synthase